MTPRGIRNNNPGNIRHGDLWIGLADNQSDPEFCTFKDARFGFRAMVKILFRYETLGVSTVGGIIERWAPSSENDTLAYIADVMKHMPVHSASQQIDVHEYSVCRPLIEAITRHEQGIQPYPEPTLIAGLAMAGCKGMPRAAVVVFEPVPERKKAGLLGWIRSWFGGGP